MFLETGEVNKRVGVISFRRAAGFCSFFASIFPEPLTKMAANWDVDQVCQWLEREGFGQYDVKFRSNAVDGATLLDISANDLKVELEIPILRDRKALLAAIETLKDGQTASAPSVPAAMSSSSHGISSHSSTEYTSSNALPPYNGSSHTTTITTSTAYTTPGYTPSPRTMQQTSTGATVSPRRFKFDDFDKEYHMKKTQQVPALTCKTTNPWLCNTTHPWLCNTPFTAFSTVQHPCYCILDRNWMLFVTRRD